MAKAHKTASTKAKPTPKPKTRKRTITTRKVVREAIGTPCPCFEGIVEHPPSVEDTQTIRVFQTADEHGRAKPRRFIGALRADAQIEELYALAKREGVAGTALLLAFTNGRATAGCTYELPSVANTSGSPVTETLNGLAAIQGLDPVAQAMLTIMQVHTAQQREDARLVAAQLTQIITAALPTALQMRLNPGAAQAATPVNEQMRLFEKISDLRVELERHKGKGMDKIMAGLADNIGTFAALAAKKLDPTISLVGEVQQTAPAAAAALPEATTAAAS